MRRERRWLFNELLEVVDQNVFVAGLAEFTGRLPQCVYGLLQLLDFFVADVGIEGVPELPLLELIDAFEVFRIEVGIAQSPVCDVFLVGPEVDASGVQLADQGIGIGRNLQLFLAHAQGQH